jgi:DNA polymerase III alpha subunit (gram-positive type)
MLGTLILDTETTGLGRSARMIQLAWKLYPKGMLQCSRSSNYIIRNVKVNNTQIHGINTNHCKLMGTDIKPVLAHFKRDLMQANLVVAHNISFDSRFITREIANTGDQDLLKLWMSTRQFCTMNNGPRTPKNRFMKLQDMYATLINKPFSEEMLHRADYDVDLCAELYFVLSRKLKEDATFTLPKEIPVTIDTHPLNQ